MRNKKYYSGVNYTKRNRSGAVIAVLVVICVLLLGVIVWASFAFSKNNDGAFKNQSEQLSELKIENEQLKKDKDDLEKENG